MTAKPEVQRYDESTRGMVEDQTGEFVTYADHAAAVAEYKADAERYRWLRAQPICHVGSRCDVSGAELDAAIDEARAGGEG